MLQYFEILFKMSLVSSSSLLVITVIICLLNIFPDFFLTCLCGRVVSKTHLPTLILTCLWMSGQVLTKALLYPNRLLFIRPLTMLPINQSVPHYTDGLASTGAAFTAAQNTCTIHRDPQGFHLGTAHTERK